MSKFSVGDKVKLNPKVEENSTLLSISKRNEYTVLTPDNFGYVRVETAKGYKSSYNFTEDRLVII